MYASYPKGLGIQIINFKPCINPSIQYKEF